MVRWILLLLLMIPLPSATYDNYVTLLYQYSNEKDNEYSISGLGFGIGTRINSVVDVQIGILQEDIHSKNGDDITANELQLGLRYALIKNEYNRIFGDLSLGIIYNSEPVPSDGTSFNFTEYIGIGYERIINDSVSVIGTIKWHHMSNAGIGRDENENPGIDAINIGISLIIWH